MFKEVLDQSPKSDRFCLKFAVFNLGTFLYRSSSTDYCLEAILLMQVYLEHGCKVAQLDVDSSLQLSKTSVQKLVRLEIGRLL